MAAMADGSTIEPGGTFIIEEMLNIHKECNYDDTLCAKKIMAMNSELYSGCEEDSLRAKIHYTVLKVKKMKKNKSKELSTFLQSCLTRPVSRDEKLVNSVDESKMAAAKMLVEKTKSVVEENKQLKRKCETLFTENLNMESEVESLATSLQEAANALSVKTDDYVKVIQDQNCDKEALVNEIQKYETESKTQNNEIDRLANEMQVLQKKLSKSNTRNVNKKLKRRDENIQKLKDEVALLKHDKSSLLIDIQKQTDLSETTQAQTETMKKQKHQLQKNQYKLKTKIHHLKQESVEIREETDNEKIRLEAEVKDKQMKIKQLQSIIDLMETDTVSTFEDGKYTNEVRECCIALLTECNVSLTKVPDIINHVLKSFTGKVPERLPSKTLLSWLMAEAKVIASRHVAEEIIKDFDILQNSGHCLHQDATSKYHNHYEGAQVTLKDGGSLTIGLKQVVGSDGQTYLQSVKEMFSDLAMSLGKGQEENTAKLICSVKNLMSDQCATNKIFNDGIEEYRNTLLPAVIENFDKLSDGEKNDLADMGRFACRLHLLANFGTEADKAMLAFETSVCDGKNPFSFNSTESGSFRLTRTSAKAFTRRGCEKAGVPDYFEPFLKGRDRTNHLVTFHGHRINVVFHDGAALYYHRNDIADFLKDWPDPNGLLQSIKFDVKENAYLAGCRALGVFDKLVTGPFWQLLETEGSILALNQHLHQMQITLAAWAQNGELPLSEESMFGDAVKVKKDVLYQSLFEDSGSPSLDAMTVMALELLSAQLLILLERQAKNPTS